MTYKIAVTSSDGIHIDGSFGSALSFRIYEVTDGEYKEAEIRSVGDELSVCNENTDSGNGSSSGCAGAGNGCQGGGCSGSQEILGKVELISDCRCVVCQKIGFPILKQLERRAITAFDVTCTVEEALNKIAAYFYKVDTHQPLRKVPETR